MAATTFNEHTMPYDAIVFIEGTSIVALDRDGDKISSGGAGTDDATVIQAAINSVTAGTVHVSYGTYTIDTRIDVNANVKLEFDHYTIVKPASDIDMFYMKNASRLIGCKIDVSSIAAYSKSCILVSGAERLMMETSTGNSVQVEDVWIVNDEYTGNAIYLCSNEAAGWGGMYGLVFRNIRIFKFMYGLKFLTDQTSQINYITASTFSTFWIYGTRRAIWMETIGSVVYIGENVFDDINIQPDLGSVPSVTPIVIQGVGNSFKNTMVWDWNTAWAYAIEFETNSTENYLEVKYGETGYVIDNGLVDNQSYHQSNTYVFLNDPRPSSTKKGLMDSRDKIKLDGINVGTSKNFLKYSQRFDNAIWDKSYISITANATTAPDGTTTADKFIESAVNDFHAISQTLSTVTANSTVSISIHAKSAEMTSCSLVFIHKDGSDSYITCNLTTGVITPHDYTASTWWGSQDCGDGWWRIWLTDTIGAGGTTPSIYFYAQTGGHLGASTGIYLWGAQVEVSPYPTLYKPTTDITYLGDLSFGLPTYDAIVYQDATTTYAVDKNGTILSSGLIATATDNVQIQAAITSLPATGGIVYIASGLYSIATTITIPYGKDGVTLKGAGTKSWEPTGTTTLQQAGNVAIITIAGTDITHYIQGIVIEDIQFQNNGAETYTGRGIDISHAVSTKIHRCNFTDLKASAIAFHTCWTADVSVCMFRKCGLTATTLPCIYIYAGAGEQSTSIWIHRCVFEKSGWKSIYMDRCLGTKIDHNDFEYASSEPSTGYIYQGTDACSVATISDNWFYDMPVTGDYICLGYYSICSNNIINGNAAGAAANGINVSGSYNVVSNNFIWNTCETGIICNAQHNSITGNSIYKCGLSGGGAQTGIKADSYTLIQGNYCMDCWESGIILANVTGVLCTGNYCSDTGSGNQNYGIYELGTSTNNVITGNFCRANVTAQISSVNALVQGNGGYVDVSELRAIVNPILELLGTPKLLCPCAEVTGTSIADYSRNANTLTASASVATLYGFRGRATYYDFNSATPHYLSRADDPDFTFGDGANDSAFSVVALVSPDDVTSRTIIAKWSEIAASPQREWRLYFDANGYPSFELYDESADTYIGREDQTAFAITANLWRVLIATYDGSKTSAGIKIYIDGAQVDDADSASGAYVAMEDGTSALYVGCQFGAAARERFYDGKMSWTCIAAKELDADEVWSLTQRLKGMVGI
jgi:hypothetical protein